MIITKIKNILANKRFHQLVKITFLGCFLFITLLFFISYIKGPKQINYLENRSAYQIPKFSIKSFLKGEYQESLENSVIDQTLGSERLKKYQIKTNNYIYQLMTSLNSKEGYYKITKEYYKYQDNDYMLYGKYNENYIKNNQETIIKIANYFKEINVEEKYLYVINSDSSLDFSNINNNFYNEIITYFEDFKTDYLEINSIDDYKKYFYKTDHHWNYLGSYQGYKDIINLMYGEKEEIKKPIETKTFKYNIYGSKAKTSQFYKFKEKFTSYVFEMPEFKTYINKELKDYGNKNLYLKDENYQKDDYIMTYGDYYGGDYGEIIYDFNNDNLENLLIIGYSDTNAINELVASHFNKTYIIDPRYIDNFQPNVYIKENDIDKLLYMGTNYSITKSTILEVGD